MSHQEALTDYIAVFVAELVQTGMTDVVVSPGSRSTPMAMVMAEHPDLNVHINVDERSAAFFALGMAKASGRPVALLCTSGTAAANYYPAVVEAYYSRVPLVVLTADRPHELRDVGAPQAIDQIHLYGKHAKWFVEMPIPEKSDEMERYVRSVCARAAATAQAAPAGPVHLNFPFREPLVPNLEKEDLFTLKSRETGYVAIEQGIPTLQTTQIEKIREQLKRHEKGIIVCGSLEEDGFVEAVVELSNCLQFPIIADPLSQLRSGKHDGTNIIDTYDTFLRNEDAKNALKPEVIIRFGAMPISKALTIFMKENHDAEQWIIDGGAGWRDPSLLSTSMIYCNEKFFCEAISAQVGERSVSEYLVKWREVNAFTKENLLRIRETSELSEGRLFHLLSDMLPEGATLFVGNSMPIRDVDSFFHFNEKSIKIMANRGANGIDGTISTALGASTVLQPLYLAVGDLTFFHDLNGLMAAKLYNLNIKIIVINNNGGGIFSFLPQSNHPKNFEKLFGTPLDLNFEHAVHMYNGSYDLITDWNHFTSSFERNLENNGLSVMEITTNRDTNLKEHRDLWNFVSQEISRLLKG
ncbi:2-succinyl-5-enolpyruvyl-6-hydroxy-3-cyclohexene-1-carboxylic-acid synthase [Robertmurraya kyonggiensis]|uniref:2-succinyl-5-enolpyruvyl-6-hydroxy-3-cyclohexene-1-carboxylate synthase n=1 Tax=Robertmurraya kyonggiensis TaxID=1037680 RepID=A0A4U1D129_9BACI|nr:2-succinyl-5-enolpyruvyl-6-hydroxy-3-cyclohexene-1-carboxylic-acid synthase [Robertmurraya kyonggiensis]TKC15912.1 2-succinyl-5-enolpyruvyl-6-hydroxy-3-cyclohexene-1-carboxylic-acid synthase [Robertmurraya kyonggiensis]